MKIDKFEIGRLFRVGEEILSGGRRSKFELLAFTDVSIQIRPTTKEGRTRLMYNRLALVVQHFNEVNPKLIEKSVFKILDGNGMRDTQNESYLYGFAREYLSRAQGSLADLDNIFQISVEKSRRDTGEQRKTRLRKAGKKPKRIATTVYVFERNPDVVAEVLDRAGGCCEASNCGSRAPFNRRSDGSPYLEVHHRVPLAEDGDDTVENAIALCPNCHRKAHYGPIATGDDTLLF